MSAKPLTHGIKFKEIVGYALGDAGGLLTFSLVSSFLQIFYTDGLGINPNQIAVLLLVARIWDAINDPMWGAFVDSRKPSKYGRFRQYTLIFAVPLAITGAVMYTKIPGLSQTQYLIFAYVSYILYGMVYTCINIPYGSLAAAMTDDGLERSSLSMWRSIGAGVGGLPAMLLLPNIVYDYLKDDKGEFILNEAGKRIPQLNTTRFSICVYVLAFVSIFVYFAHFKMTKERVEVPPKQKAADYNVFKTVKMLAKNRPFVMACLASMLLICFQMYTQTIYNYLLKDFYGKPGLYTLVTVFTYLPMAMFIPVMNKLIKRFGKKELCAAGIGFSAVVNIIMYLIGFTPLVSNPYIFLALLFFSGAGQTFLILEVWALVMDVMDYHEYLSGRREEGTSYAVFSFTRKLGQTIAGAGSSYILSIIGYDVAKAGFGQSAEVVDKMYSISTLIPAILLVIIFLILTFGYNLTKNKVAELHENLTRISEENENNE